MRVLLDTHVPIWAMEANPRLTARALEIIADGDIEAFLSIASIWEIAIKRSIGKLRLPDTWLDDLSERLRSNRVGILAISPSHCDAVAELPIHHRDPFDRMLIAQAQHEGLGIVSADPALDAYGVERIW
jgi:PIN domain nuclease of toxin-antitoxin system